MAGVTAIILKSCGVTRAYFGHRISLCLVIVLFLSIPSAHYLNKLYLKESHINVILNETESVRLVQIGQYNRTLTVAAYPQYPDIVAFVPNYITISGSTNPSTVWLTIHYLYAFGKHPGHSRVTFGATPQKFINLDSEILFVTVLHSLEIYMISVSIGWLYFMAWSLSFYPQIFTNYKRKSVIGLNPDFLALNFVGYTMYSLFNCGLYFNKANQMEYFKMFPRGHNPVHLNDVFFSLHASFATLLTITQSMRFTHTNQRVSVTARCVLFLIGFLIVMSAGYSAGGTITWLGFLYHCSYVQIVTTLLKFTQQAYMNYSRKSTVNWSIETVLLEITGGVLSVVQMILNAWNYRDWRSILGDVTKFSLGMFTLLFDLFFMLQHYVVYRK